MANFNNEHFQVTSIGGGSASAAADLLREEITGKEIDEPEPEPEPVEPHVPTEAEAETDAARKRAQQAEEVAANEAAERAGTITPERRAVLDAEAAGRAGTVTPEQQAVLDADLQEVIEWEDARSAERMNEDAAERGEVTVPEAADALEQQNVVMLDLADVQEIVEAEEAIQADQDRQARYDALKAEQRAAKEAERAAKRAAYYDPQPEIPGAGHGFELEM